MNSRQRIIRTIKGEKADRTPIALFIHDEGNFLSQVYPVLNKEKPLECIYKLIDLQRELGLDIFLRLLNKMTPEWISYGGLNTETQTENWEIHNKNHKRGNSTVTSYHIKTPAGDFQQEFTFSEVAPLTMNYACTKKPIHTLEELEAVIAYEPPMDPAYPEKLKKIITKAKDYLKDDGILSIWAPGCAFNAAANLISLDMLYSLFLTDIIFFEKLMETCIKRTFPFIEAICKSGIDVINLGGNVPGGFLGRKFYEKFVMPYEKKYIDLANKLGVFTLYHNCGQANALVESYILLGSDIVEPFSPPPFGDNALSDIKIRSKGKFTIIGNIDQENILKRANVEKVKEVTRETLMIGKKDGHFILQNADYLEYGTPINNVKAYIETGKKYGEY